MSYKITNSNVRYIFYMVKKEKVATKIVLK